MILPVRRKTEGFQGRGLNWVNFGSAWLLAFQVTIARSPDRNYYVCFTLASKVEGIGVDWESKCLGFMVENVILRVL